MRPGAILQAAMDVVGAIEAATQPADRMLKDWAKANRYAGSKDRAALGEIVFGVFRHRGSLAWTMGGDSPRALVLAHQVVRVGLSLDELSAQCSGHGYDTAPLSQAERTALSAIRQDDPPPAVRAEVPGWMLGEVMAPLDAIEAFAAMTARAPLDLRANTLKTTRDEALTRLMKEGRGAPAACIYSPVGIRYATQVSLQNSSLVGEGHVEVQDEGSQIVSLMIGARPGSLVVELCAGAGGKTLALGAAMKNEGTILAGDTDARRLKECDTRAARAGLAIVETKRLRDWAPGEGADPDLAEWSDRADLVVLDVPCSGSGTWRRQPEAKWRLAPERLSELAHVQGRLLARGAGLVRPGGRLAYITCSLFEAENTAPIARFLAQNKGFRAVCQDEAWAQVKGANAPLPQAGYLPGALILAPHLSHTDGFFLSILERKA